MRRACARLDIAKLNELLNFKGDIEVIGAGVVNSDELVLYLTGQGLPEQPEVKPPEQQPLPQVELEDLLE